MGYNYIPKYIRQSETKRTKDVITAARWNELFNLLIEQGDYTAEELGKILNHFTGVVTDLEENLQTALDGKLDALSTDPVVRGAFVKVGEDGQAVYDKTSYASLYTLESNYRTASAQNAIDNDLQGQIDAIVSSSDVKDVVGTYEALLAYDTSTLGNKDIVKVLSDSLHDNARSYFRWIITNGVGSWLYIGSEAESYTKAESDILLARKLNKNLGAANAGKVLVVGESGEVVFVELTPTIPEAPTDGKQYARQDGAWAEVIGGGGGTSDHSQLTNRDANNQHPMSAITGLEREINMIGDAFDDAFAGLRTKQDKLIAGAGITIAADGKTISASGGASYDDTELRERIATIEGKEASWNGKQNAIADLATIRSGAALGATAVQKVADAESGNLAIFSTDGSSVDLDKSIETEIHYTNQHIPTSKAVADYVADAIGNAIGGAY